MAQAFPRHGDSTLTCPEKYERALLSHAVTELPRPAQERYQHTHTHITDTHHPKMMRETCFSCSDAGSGHHSEEEQVATRFEGEIQQLFQQLRTMSPPPAEQPGGPVKDSRPQSSAPASSSSSSSSNTPSRSKLSRRNTLPTPAEGRSSSSDETLTAKSGPKNPASPAPEVNSHLLTVNPHRSHRSHRSGRHILLDDVLSSVIADILNHFMPLT